MEVHLTLEELQAIIDASRQKEEREQRFLAAMQGIDLDKDKGDEEVDRIKRRVEAKLQNKSEEEVRLESIGLTYEKG